MKNVKLFILALFSLAMLAMNAQAFELSVEEAAETTALKITLDEETATGTIYAKVCDHCEELKLAVTPETRAFAGKTQVGIAQAKDRLGRYATVTFNKHTKEVIRIRW